MIPQDPNLIIRPPSKDFDFEELDEGEDGTKPKKRRRKKTKKPGQDENPDDLGYDPQKDWISEFENPDREEADIIDTQ